MWGEDICIMPLTGTPESLIYVSNSLPELALR